MSEGTDYQHEEILMSKLFFDQQDYELLTIVNEVLNREGTDRYLKNLFIPYMHPNGIKEMAASKELRIAMAVIHLLDMLETGGIEERLSALRCLKDEVLHCARSHLRINTARVLLQIMKELVRAHDDHQRQLELAHDFRRASSGKPRFVRRQLKRYHLLEMPEDWNQITFDHHIHDVNTKGRKSPTHLIMDAWIKGIRSLTVIHYNYVLREAVEELLEAAEIMDIRVRIGIEFSARYRDRYVQIIWTPRGFGGITDFLNFLSKQKIQDLMSRGRQVSEYQQGYVWNLFQAFNQKHLADINQAYHLEAPELDREAFVSFIGPGQVSILHLCKYVHRHLIPFLKKQSDRLRDEYEAADPADRPAIAEKIKELDQLDSEAILDKYLSIGANPELGNPKVPRDTPEIPELLTHSPAQLINELVNIRTGFSLTLNLSSLRVEDVLELIYDSRGAITHLEIFNLKDHINGTAESALEINQLQQAINQGSAVHLKRVLRQIIQKVDASNLPDRQDRLEKLHEILRNIGALKEWYSKTPLKARIGSDSTGSSSRVPGMGLAVLNTLPARAQHEFLRNRKERHEIPVHVTTTFSKTYHTANHDGIEHNIFFRAAHRLSWARFIGVHPLEKWKMVNASTVITPNGNLVSLGGIRRKKGNGFRPDPERENAGRKMMDLRYLNSDLKNVLKIIIGFIPAFITFYLTKDWWLLAYFGAVIWFGITGLRNVIQSVLGAGGIRRSPLLRWQDYVSWDRLADSLLFTGYSVPLLDYVVKTLLLERGFNITTSTNPILLYSVISVANGVYISGHNILRGLPRGAIYGNGFRSILSIPIALAINTLAADFLFLMGTEGIDRILQKWAAIISKAASDCVAGVIEGSADRFNNVRIRTWDYSGKLRQMFNTFAQLELTFPEMDVLEMLDSPKKFLAAFTSEAGDLVKLVIINSLDLLYFWMYQPRSRSVLKRMLRQMSHEERLVFERSQFVLYRYREISQLFVDGLVGKKFSRALSFYLDRSESYLATMHALLAKIETTQPCPKDPAEVVIGPGGSFP